MNKNPKKEKIVLIGSGNVAGYLARSLYASGHKIDMVYSRTRKNAQMLAEKVNAGWTDKIEVIDSDAGIWIFALTDTATVDKVKIPGLRMPFYYILPEVCRPIYFPVMLKTMEYFIPCKPFPGNRILV
jgi:hypothetical protein